MHSMFGQTVYGIQQPKWVGDPPFRPKTPQPGAIRRRRNLDAIRMARAETTLELPDRSNLALEDEPMENEGDREAPVDHWTDFDWEQLCLIQ